MPLSKESIAKITYSPSLGTDTDEPLRYATGFFINSEEFGPACVTCAHVVHAHPGPNYDVLYVNGHQTAVLLDAGRDFGVDVALLQVPPKVLESGITFHLLGRSSAVNRIYYSHGWSVLQGQESAVEFVKVWGPRFDHSTVQSLRAGTTPHNVWRLRNDVFDPKSGRTFSTKNFAPGWSGAPVFNVREDLHEHRVIGVLSIVAEQEGKALAVSIESLDFLRPADEQCREGWFGPAPENFWRRLGGRLGLKAAGLRTQVIRYDDETPERHLHNIRFREITAQPVSPPRPAPPSPYDDDDKR